MTLQGKLEAAANVATVVVAVLLSAALIKIYFVPTRAPKRPQMLGETVVGTNLEGRVPGIDWKKNGRTLVLAISTQCHFCQESTPFYRKLRGAVGSGLKTVAVLPQPVSTAQQYLEGAGVHVDQIKQVTMGDIGVRGAPTLFLVNGAGAVTKVWVGKLAPEQEEQVLTALGKG